MDMRRHVEAWQAMPAEQRRARELAAVGVLDQIGARLRDFLATTPMLLRELGARLEDAPCRE